METISHIGIYEIVRDPDTAHTLSCDTHLYGAIVCPPVAIAQLLGPAHPGDGFKVSREWVFQHGELVFTVYDWKMTYLYDVDLLTPEQFWSIEFDEQLHVGSKSPATKEDATAFSTALKTAIGASGVCPCGKNPKQAGEHLCESCIADLPF